MKRWTASWDLLDFKIGSVMLRFHQHQSVNGRDYSDQPPPNDFAGMLEHLFQRASEQSISTFPFSDQTTFMRGFVSLHPLDCVPQLHYSAKWRNPMRLAKRSSTSCERRRSPGSQQICGPSQTSALCSKLLHF